MAELSELEATLLAACRIALRQLDYDGDDKTAFHGAARDALTKAIGRAEAVERGLPADQDANLHLDPRETKQGLN